MKRSFYVVITLIPRKENGIITAKHLSMITGYTETFIRKIINEARSAGYPICSNRHGYYLSTECSDISDTIKFLSRRINTQLQAINGLKNINEKEK